MTVAYRYILSQVLAKFVFFVVQMIFFGVPGKKLSALYKLLPPYVRRVLPCFGAQYYTNKQSAVQKSVAFSREGVSLRTACCCQK